MSSRWRLTAFLEGFARHTILAFPLYWRILKPKKLKPRILFYGGLKTTTYPMLFKDTYDAATGFTVNQYAYCGMWDDPIQPQHD